MPSDILSHVLHTMPYIGFNPIPDVPTLNLDNLSSLNKYGKDVFLTSIENVTTYPQWFLGEIPDATGALRNSTACAVVVVEKSAQDLDAFYFYFYSFNEGGDITQVLPPLDRIFPDSKPGDHFGDHVGDWEHNMIRFKDGKPTGIYFSAHGSGEACDWNGEACLSKQGDRPVVFSARGSHANYPSEGHHIHDEALIDLADKGRIWDPIKPAYFYKYDPTTDILTAAEPGTDPTDWFHFNGAWGDKKYADTDPRQKTVPYFGLKKYENGPTGPKFKHLVRKGLFPDEPEKPNLMKTLVRWYMSMYDSYLRGWNPWVVIIFVVLVLVATICLMVFAVRRIGPLMKGWFMNLRKRWRRQDNEAQDSEVHLGLLDPTESRGAEEEDER
jgi:Vacuolar protein sorting-associated protein 62